MNPGFLILVLALLFFTLRVVRKTKKAGPKKVEGYHRRIEGLQVEAALHPFIGRDCLLDNGMQFGKGFKRKTGPGLPHDSHCRCRETRFNFTSSEVFNGALRASSRQAGQSDLFGPETTRLLLTRLRDQLDTPLPPTPEEYGALLGLQDFVEEDRPGIAALLEERHRFLSRPNPQSPPAAKPSGKAKTARTAKTTKAVKSDKVALTKTKAKTAPANPPKRKTKQGDSTLPSARKPVSGPAGGQTRNIKQNP